MRLLPLLTCATLGLAALASMTPTAAAQGYLERKDADAAAVIERAAVGRPGLVARDHRRVLLPARR